LHIVTNEVRIDPWKRITFYVEGGFIANSEKALVANVLNVLLKDRGIHTDHRSVFKEVVGPVFFLFHNIHEELQCGVVEFGSNFTHLGIIFSTGPQIKDVLGSGEVQGLVSGNEFDDFCVTFKKFAFGEGEGAGEGNVETDGFEGVYSAKGEVQTFFNFI